MARAQHRGPEAPRLRAVRRHPALPAAQLRRAQPRLLTAAPPPLPAPQQPAAGILAPTSPSRSDFTSTAVANNLREIQLSFAPARRYE